MADDDKKQTDAKLSNPIGYYWVKVPGGFHLSEDSWEPAYFNGNEINGWGLCGEDPTWSEEDFLQIASMELKSPDSI